MSRFQKLLFNLCGTLSCVSNAAGLIGVFGYEGGDVNVSCSYPDGYETYEKYLCKNDCAYSDILITTTQRNTSRHFIYDDKSKRVFTTTISKVLSTDAGKYWCGVSRNSKDLYTEVRLETIQDSCCQTMKNIQVVEEGSVSITCSYESESVNKLKYICKGHQPSLCLKQAVITSENIQNGRFSVTNDRKSKFTVMISNMTRGDSGSYLCGVQRNSGGDVFSGFDVKVKEWCCVKSEEIRGTVGRSVTLKCPYPSTHRNNRKFLCKGSKRSSCSDMMAHKRFSLRSDSTESFSVTITQLEVGDAGTFWCRSDPQWNTGNYTQFHVSVVNQHESRTVITHQTTSVSKEITEGFPDVARYSVFAVLAVILPITIIIIIIIVVKVCKCNKVKEMKVIADKKKLDCVDEQDVCEVEDLYQNRDSLVMRLQQSASMQKNYTYHINEKNEDEADYENVTAAEDVYCNEDFHKTLRK